MGSEGKHASSKRSAHARGVLFEFDHIGLGARQAAFDVLRAELGKKGADLNAGVFVRHCLSSGPMYGIPALLNALSLDSSVVGDVQSAFEREYAAALDRLAGQPSGGLRKLLSIGAEAHVVVGSISGLPLERARSLAERLGLSGLPGALLATSNEERCVPSADSWLKLARSLSVPPEECVAVVSSAGACRAALAAGMRCVAIPDAFTAHMDFGGADMVGDALNGEVIHFVRNVLDID